MDPSEQSKSIKEVLQMMFLWPKGNDPNKITNFFYMRYFSIYLFFALPPFLTIAHAYHYRFVANSTMGVDLIVILVLTSLIIMFILYACDLKLVIENVNFYHHQIDSLHTIRINYKGISRFVRYALAIAIFLLGLFARWDDARCEKRKTRYNSLESCGLLFPIYLPFEYNFSPLKQYIQIHQAVGMVVLFTAILQMALLFLFGIVNVVGILNNLIRLAEDFDTALKHDHEVTGRLRTMVKIHQFLISYNRHTDKIAMLMNMTMYTFGGLIMATSIFDLIKTGSLIAVLHGSGWAVCLALLQSAGQVPISKGLEFEKALYHTHWYKLKKSEDRVCFLLMLQMSQKPVAFHAGPTAEVSLPTLMAILKAAYSGTTMLINATK